MANKNSFIVWQELSDVIDRLNDEQAGQIFKAMLEYNRTAEEPKLDAVLSIVFIPIKQSMDRNRKNYDEKCSKNKENIKKRWQKRDTNVYDRINENTNVYEAIRTDTNAYLSDNDPDPDNDPDNDRDKKKDTPIGVSKEKPANTETVRHKYGEYKNVMLTDEQYENLKTEFPLDYKDRIERLSEYMSSTGKVYKNHLTTIKAWARMEKERGKTQGKARAAPNRSFRSGQEDIYSDEIYEVF